MTISGFDSIGSDETPSMGLGLGFNFNLWDICIFIQKVWHVCWQLIYMMLFFLRCWVCDCVCCNVTTFLGVTVTLAVSSGFVSYNIIVTIHNTVDTVVTQPVFGTMGLPRSRVVFLMILTVPSLRLVSWVVTRYTSNLIVFLTSDWLRLYPCLPPHINSLLTYYVPVS